MGCSKKTGGHDSEVAEKLQMRALPWKSGPLAGCGKKPAEDGIRGIAVDRRCRFTLMRRLWCFHSVFTVNV
jgi:hypothetical protein